MVSDMKVIVKQFGTDWPHLNLYAIGARIEYVPGAVI